MHSLGAGIWWARTTFLVLPWVVSLTHRNEVASVSSAFLVDGGCWQLTRGRSFVTASAALQKILNSWPQPTKSYNALKVPKKTASSLSSPGAGVTQPSEEKEIGCLALCWCSGHSLVWVLQDPSRKELFYSAVLTPFSTRTKSQRKRGEWQPLFLYLITPSVPG